MNKVRVMCNASPVIGLLAINKLPLLWKLFDEVLIPETVYRELCADSQKHKNEITLIKEAVKLGNLSIYQVKNAEAVKALYGKLHFGELEVIVGAKEEHIKLAVIDEKAARKMASDLLVDTIGILGILLLAKQRGLIDRVKLEVDKLRANGYRISERLYWRILNQASELDMDEEEGKC